MASAPADIRAALAPAGRLRTGMNFSNTILTQRDRGDGQPGGVAAELARELGRRLGVEVDFIAYDSPGEVVDALSEGKADICFLAVEPARAERIDFTAPYVLIESTYLVRADSPVHHPGDMDRTGVRIGVMGRAAYDLYLTRTLKSAELVRGTGDYLDAFAAGETDAAAGIRQMLNAYAAAHPGLRVMPEPFAIVSQAMGAPKGNKGGAYLRAYVEEMKASGFVARALAASGQEATVAPPG
jgi:polar amino acid transport system substrate-binding protein